MFSLDFSLFYDNSFIAVSLMLSYFIFQKSILPLFVHYFKIQSSIHLILYKELQSYNYMSRSLLTLKFFDTYKSLGQVFFLAECKPTFLNYSYLS